MTMSSSGFNLSNPAGTNGSLSLDNQSQGGVTAADQAAQATANQAASTAAAQYAQSMATQAAAAAAANPTPASTSTSTPASTAAATPAASSTSSSTTTTATTPAATAAATAPATVSQNAMIFIVLGALLVGGVAVYAFTQQKPAAHAEHGARKKNPTGRKRKSRKRKSS
jgi:hypothetical protein